MYAGLVVVVVVVLVVVVVAVVEAVVHGIGVKIALYKLQGPASTSIQSPALAKPTKHFDCFVDQLTHPQPSVHAA